MIKPSCVRHLRPWEEVVGYPTELTDEEDVSLAKVSGITLAIPPDIAEVLRQHVGQKIALLRTDDSARPYRFRIVTKKSPAGAGNTDIGEENCAQTTGATEGSEW